MSEIERVRTVQSLNIIGSAAEPEFDRLARLSGHVADADYAHICFIDDKHHFSKAMDGIRLPQIFDRADSLCLEAVISNRPILIPDLSADERPHSRRLNQQYGLTSYVSVPIPWINGQAIGAIAAISKEQRTLSKRRLAALQECASLVCRELLIRQAAGEEARRGAVPITSTAAATPDLVRAITRNHLSVLKSVSDGVIAVRGDGVINFVNPAAEKILGRSAPSLLGSTFAALFNVSATGAMLPDLQCLVAAGLRDGKERLAKRAYCLAADRTVLKVEYAVSPVETQATIIGAVIVFRRISDVELPNGVELRKTLREVSRLKEQIARLAAARTSVESLVATELPDLRAQPSTRFEELLRIIDKEHSDQSLRARALSTDCAGMLTRVASLPGPKTAVPAGSLVVEAETRSSSRVVRWLAS